MAFDPYIRKKEVEGAFFDFWIADDAAREWYDLQSFDGTWIEMRFIRDHLLRPGQVIFDCGAHQGCTAIAFSTWTGATGQVVAFEPGPHNAAMIRKNIELNGIRNIRVEEKAVGAARGSAFISDKSNSSVSLGATSGIEVEVTCLDCYSELKPGLLKIDVEGFEAEVLKGAREILRNVPALAIEIHPYGLTRYGSSVEELLAMIDLQKYTLWMQWDQNSEPQPYDMTIPVSERVHLFAIPR